MCLPLGYLNNRESSEQMIDGDGWLHTGDVGYYDKDEHFFIVDKLKDLIKFRGHQVSCDLSGLSHTEGSTVKVLLSPSLWGAYLILGP